MLQSYRSQGCPTLKTSGWTQKAERGALKNKPEYLFSPHTQSVSKWFGRDFGFINCSLCPRRAFGCLKKRLSPLCWLFLGALCHVCLSQGGQAFVLSQQMQMAWIFNLLCNGLIFFFFFSLPVFKYKSITHATFFLQKCQFGQFQVEPRFLGASQHLEITVLKI